MWFLSLLFESAIYSTPSGDSAMPYNVKKTHRIWGDTVLMLTGFIYSLIPMMAAYTSINVLIN